jgi:hypothetical protein
MSLSYLIGKVNVFIIKAVPIILEAFEMIVIQYEDIKKINNAGNLFCILERKEKLIIKNTIIKKFTPEQPLLI